MCFIIDLCLFIYLFNDCICICLNLLLYLIGSKIRNGLPCADVPIRNNSLIHSLTPPVRALIIASGVRWLQRLPYKRFKGEVVILTVTLFPVFRWQTNRLPTICHIVFKWCPAVMLHANANVVFIDELLLWLQMTDDGTAAER